jgi:hypothetical protein
MLSPKSALGTLDRMISFNNLDVDHLSKQQVVASKHFTPRPVSRDRLVEFSFSISTLFGEAFFTIWPSSI